MGWDSKERSVRGGRRMCSREERRMLRPLQYHTSGEIGQNHDKRNSLIFLDKSWEFGTIWIRQRLISSQGN